MKKAIAVIAAFVALAFLVIPAVVFASGGFDGKAKADPPLSNVKASFKFVEAGGVLTITGNGEGFEPGESYISLIYGEGSEVDGPEACEPSGALPGNLMFVGTWDVSDNGTGKLIQAGPASGASLADIATISVRRVTVMFSAEFGPVDVSPVVACGAVK